MPGNSIQGPMIFLQHMAAPCALIIRCPLGSIHGFRILIIIRHEDPEQAEKSMHLMQILHGMHLGIIRKLICIQLFKRSPMHGSKTPKVFLRGFLLIGIGCKEFLIQLL